ncbi:hypothetical protein FACS1894184_16370 [Clostridia bacterium]|nr:hypothetical protein FACS1894184_16370 [Clostridia bacterium]
MRILSKKNYLLRQGIDRFLTTRGIEQEMPDKFAQSATFIAAKANGNIQVIEAAAPKKAKKQAETTPTAGE